MKGRIALVTGANRRIGLEVSRRLIEQGMTVVLSGRDEAAVERAAALVGGEPLVLDVTRDASVDAAKRHVEARFGRLDVLVNNAAIYVDSTQLDEVRRSMETNLYGPLRLCRAFVPAMVSRRFGRVVNVSTAMAQLSTMGVGFTAYRTSKAALNAYTRVLAAETRGSNVLVNAICPGWVRTRMGGRSAPRSVEEGAEGIVWAATLEDAGPTGGFFQDGAPMDW